MNLSVNKAQRFGIAALGLLASFALGCVSFKTDVAEPGIDHSAPKSASMDADTKVSEEEEDNQGTVDPNLQAIADVGLSESSSCDSNEVGTSEQSAAASGFCSGTQKLPVSSNDAATCLMARASAAVRCAFRGGIKTFSGCDCIHWGGQAACFYAYCCNQ